MLEMSHAIAIEEGDTSFEDPIEMDKILCHCSSLVRENNGVLTFSHFSVKEYLKSIKPDDPLLSQFRAEDELDNEYMATTCLTYLLLGDLEQTLPDSEELMESFMAERHFHDYASIYWRYHARDLIGKSNAISALVDTLFLPHKTDHFVLWAYTWIKSFVDQTDLQDLLSNMTDITPLHLACMCGLFGVVDRLINAGADVNHVNGVVGSPLVCVSGVYLLNKFADCLPLPEQRRHVAERLLRQNFVQDSWTTRALQGAIYHDDAILLAILLDAGCALTTEVLRFASEIGSQSIVDALMDAVGKQNLDPDSEIVIECHRLLACRGQDMSESGKLQESRSIIPSGASRHLMKDYQPVIQAASKNGQVSRLQHFLPSLSSLSEPEKQLFLSECLCDAAESGHTEVAKLLLQEGANLAYRSQPHGEIALQKAAGNRRFQMVQLLLSLSDNPATSIEAHDDLGWAAWMDAVRSGSI